MKLVGTFISNIFSSMLILDIFVHLFEYLDNFDPNSPVYVHKKTRLYFLIPVKIIRKYKLIKNQF